MASGDPALGLAIHAENLAQDALQQIATLWELVNSLRPQILAWNLLDPLAPAGQPNDHHDYWLTAELGQVYSFTAYPLETLAPDNSLPDRRITWSQEATVMGKPQGPSNTFLEAKLARSKRNTFTWLSATFLHIQRYTFCTTL